MVEIFAGCKGLISEAEVKRMHSVKLESTSVQQMPAALRKPVVICNSMEAQKVYDMIIQISVRAIAFISKFSVPKIHFSVFGSEKFDITLQVPFAFVMAVWVDTPGHSPFVEVFVIDNRENDFTEWIQKFLSFRTPYIFHGFKSDYFSLRSMGVTKIPRIIYDTKIAASCIHLGEFQGQDRTPWGPEVSILDQRRGMKERRRCLISLRGQCHTLGLPIENLSEVDNEPIGRYGGRIAPSEAESAINRGLYEVEAILGLYNIQQRQIHDRGLANELYCVQFPAAIAHARMEWKGIMISEDALRDCQKAFQLMSEDRGRTLIKMGMCQPLNDSNFINLMCKLGYEKEFGFFRLHSEMKLDKDRLESFESLHPAVRVFKEYRVAAGGLGTMFLSPGSDGRVHPSFDQVGAATGRSTCHSPNVMGIQKRVRPLVIAPEGNVIIELDYVQQEVGIMAGEYGDPNMIEDFNSGDFFARCAQKLAARDLEVDDLNLDALAFACKYPELRAKAKNITYSIVYNCSDNTLARKMSTSRSIASSFRQSMLDSYPVLRDALERIDRFSGAVDYVSSSDGLRRYLDCGLSSWRKKTLCRNSPIQMIGASILKKALIAIDQAYANPGLGVSVILSIYDAILIECPYNAAESVKHNVAQIMRDAFTSLYPNLKPQIKASVSHCWNHDGKTDSIRDLLEEESLRLSQLHSP